MEGYYCCVPSCCHSSSKLNKRERLTCGRVSFHSFPSLTTDKERTQNWIVKIQREPGKDFVINKNTKICSEHFKPKDFLCNGVNPQAPRRVLKKTAVPSQFPWVSVSKERTTTTSQRVALELECDSSSSEEDCIISSNESSENETDAEDIDCDSSEYLNAKVAELSDQLAETQAKYERSLFCHANINEDDGLFLFTLASQTIIVILESDIKVMRQWRGGRSKHSYHEVKTRRNYKLLLLEQLFLKLVRLRFGDPELDLANRFGLSQSCVSRIPYHNYHRVQIWSPLITRCRSTRR